LFCNEGFISTSYEGYITCRSGEWRPSPYVTTPLECIPLTFCPILFPQTSRPGFTHRPNCEFGPFQLPLPGCSIDFRFENGTSVTRTCQIDGTWSGSDLDKIIAVPVIPLSHVEGKHWQFLWNQVLSQKFMLDLTVCTLIGIVILLLLLFLLLYFVLRKIINLPKNSRELPGQEKTVYRLISEDETQQMIVIENHVYVPLEEEENCSSNSTGYGYVNYMSLTDNVRTYAQHHVYENE